MLVEDGQVKARYARTMLRVARGADRQMAARLVGGLVRDVPHANERLEIRRLHFAAIAAFAGLAKALDDPIPSNVKSVGTTPQMLQGLGCALWAVSDGQHVDWRAPELWHSVSR